jgi:hypothetical protein
MSDLPFQGAHLGELAMEKQQVSINRDWLPRVDQFEVAPVEVLLTVTKDIRSASWRCATAVCRKNIDNTPAKSMTGLKSD